jgi:hypothetical protein
LVAITVKQARAGMSWLVEEWQQLRDTAPHDNDPAREEQFAHRLSEWVSWDMQLWIRGQYQNCVMGDSGTMCPADAPLCCGGCARKRMAMAQK